MNNSDLNFAYKVRHALNENLDNLPASTADRLASARKIAMSHKKQDNPPRLLATQQRTVVAGGAGRHFGDSFDWLGRIGIALPLLALVAGLIGIYQFEEQKHISDTADIDAAVLSDELPVSAYLDHGFNTFISTRGE
ncbi:DUF3619 family protein [Undibacterium arcticum]|uniref:DUF3619 family protein n=1 Tax=Undibacterium arcticum TaxID=1762892 RepID=A0ABV7F9H9_9BURK